MSRLTKVIDGVLFRDDFNSEPLNAVYTTSSSDPSRFSLTEKPGYLRLKHGESSFLVLIDVPEGDFVMEIRNDYVPKIVGDVAGMIIWKSMEDYVRLLEWRDETQDSTFSYPYMRISKKGILYSGYGSQDGSIWNLIGTISLEGAGKVGLVIDGSEEMGSVPFDVDYFKLYRSNFLSVANLPEGFKVQILDSTSKVIADTTVKPGLNGAKVDLTNFICPFDGKIVVLDDLENPVYWSSGVIPIHQGDIYYYGEIIDVYKVDSDKETLINMTDVIDLGNMNSGNIEGRFKVNNAGQYPFYNVTVTPVPSGSIFGYQWVQIGMEGVDGTVTEYLSTISIPEVKAGEAKYFRIRIVRDVNQLISSIDPYKFNLLVMHD